MIASLIVVGLAIGVTRSIARRGRLVEPLLLVVLGILLSFLPHLPPIAVEPEIVLSVILPLLLYWEALNIPLRRITRAPRRGTLTGTVMVLVVAVALVFVEWWASLTLGTALLIGADIERTDATAVSGLGKGIPRGGRVVQRAEPLIDDGTALILSAFAQLPRAVGVRRTGGHPGQLSVHVGGQGLASRRHRRAPR